jgi:LexA-binding, inner membrane-associated putative hydrolase
MANFTTHIGVGTVVAGALATLTLAADVVAPENIVAVTMAGVLGSVLPDIDLKDSRPSRAMFAGLAVFFSFAVLFTFATQYSIAEMLILWLGTLVFVRYGLHAVFHRVSVHRGIWHSILAGVFAAVATAAVFKHLLGRHDGVAWLAAGFMFVGFLTHLVLDEVYSVDVMDTRIKASFGTALKLADSRHPGHSLVMAVAAALAFYLSPPTETFVETVASRSLWAELQQRLLPEDRWFGLIDRRGRFAVQRDDGAANITTGSLPVPAGGVRNKPRP